MSLLDKPNDNIAEISLLGTGGGYGESCVIHAGNQNWIIIDSCVDPKSNLSLPLEYLKQINVDVAKEVKLILCTHWHDDHILGISKVLEECKSAHFSFAKTLDRAKFLRLVSLDYQKLKKEASNSATIEFNKCIQIIDDREIPIKEAVQDKTLISFNLHENIRSEFISLSPSDYTVSCFNQEISTLMETFGAPNTKIQIKSPNSKSVVLFAKIGPHRAILGADLEVTNNVNEGWLDIIQNSQVIDKKSSLFKIPHHGSLNGYHEDIWIKLLVPNPISKLTPWNKNNKLPNADMLIKYSSLSERLFMTSPIISDKPKKREKQIEKLIGRLKYKLREVKYKKGIIRCRVNILEENSTWETSLFEHAFHVNKELEKME